MVEADPEKRRYKIFSIMKSEISLYLHSEKIESSLVFRQEYLEDLNHRMIIVFLL